jgi:hypothetical protein
MMTIISALRASEWSDSRFGCIVPVFHWTKDWMGHREVLDTAEVKIM